MYTIKIKHKNLTVIYSTVNTWIKIQENKTVEIHKNPLNFAVNPNKKTCAITYNFKSLSTESRRPRISRNITSLSYI